MLEFGIDRNRELIRQTMLDLNQAKISEKNQIIDDAIRFFNRQTEHDDIRGKMKSRYAVGVQKVGGVSGGLGGFETYKRGLLGEQIDLGFFETITTGVANKVIDSIANLFTSKTQSWSYVTGEGDAVEKSEDAAALIEAHRKAGGADTVLVNTDSLSCGVNTSFMLLGWVGGHLKYSLVSPTSINFIYHDTIKDDGVDRGVDYTEIEDATAVVIRLSECVDANPGEGQYLAIFGRSEIHDYGRYVTYRSSKWDEIPEVGRGGVDYTLESGEIANPLSWLADKNPKAYIPEYPIIKLDGGLMRVSSKLIETTTSLYENMVELDLSYSRVLKAALVAAIGTAAVVNPRGDPLPPTLEGAVALMGDQTMELYDHSGANSVAALEVLKGLTVAIGNSYSAPDYTLVSDAQSLSASSGVALAIRTKPLIEFRDYRIEVNGPSVDRMFEIERGLIEAYTGDTSLQGVKQIWNPGEIKVPEDKTEQVARLKAAEDAGLADHVMSVKEYHGLATDEEAIALIERMEERKVEFPGPQPPQAIRGAQPVGITRGQT